MYINTNHRLPEIRLSGRVSVLLYVRQAPWGGAKKMAQPLKICHMWFSRAERVLDKAESGSDLNGGITPLIPSLQTYISHYHDRDL